MKEFQKGVALCVALLCAPSISIAAEPVTVSSDGGGLVITGEVLSFDGTYLRLDSQFGAVTVDFTGMTCDGEGCAPLLDYVPTVRFAGAPRLSEVLFPALVEGYARSKGYFADRIETDAANFDYLLGEDDRSVLKLSFSVNDSGEGFAAQVAERADIALSLRTATAEEASPDRLRIIALEALTPVVSPAQPLTGISLADLGRVLAGEIKDWAELGSSEGPITLVQSDKDPAYAAALEATILTPLGLTLAPEPRGFATNTEAAAEVSADASAIAILPVGALGNTRALAVSEPCGLQAVPRSHSIKAEDYPLTFPLYYYLPARRLPPQVLDFLAWLNTSEAQLVIRRTGLIDLGAVPIPIASQGERLAAAITMAGAEVGLDELQRMVRFFNGRVRLSSTFRFEAGSTALDAPSRSHLQSIAAALGTGRYAGQQITLVGFSDAEGPADANRNLSRERAEAVRDALIAAVGPALSAATVIEVEAFGEAMPMGCDDTSWGRRINRRVELWVSE